MNKKEYTTKERADLIDRGHYWVQRWDDIIGWEGFPTIARYEKILGLNNVCGSWRAIGTDKDTSEEDVKVLQYIGMHPRGVIRGYK